jgi:hypothetical protein
MATEFPSNLAARLGSAAGSGVSSALQSGIDLLQQHKINQMASNARQQQAKQNAPLFEALLPDHLKHLAPIIAGNEKYGAKILENLGGNLFNQSPTSSVQNQEMTLQREQQPYQQQGNGLQQLIQSSMPQRQGVGQLAQGGLIEKLLGGGMRNLSQPMDINGAVNQQALERLGVTPELVQQYKQMQAQQAQQQSQQPQQAQQPGQAPQQPLQPNIQPKFAEDNSQLWMNPQDRRQAAQLNQQQRLHTDKQYTKYAEKIEESGRPSRQAAKLVDEALELMDTGKVISGIKGKYTPAFLQSEEGQALMSKLNKLVLIQAQLGKGVPSKLRLSLEELSKPAVWQQPKVIRKLLNDIKYDPEVQRDIYLDKAREQVEMQYGDNLPKNFKPIIQERANLLQKADKTFETKLVLPTNVYDDGTPVVNGDEIKADGVNYIREGGRWRPI